MLYMVVLIDVYQKDINFIFIFIFITHNDHTQSTRNQSNQREILQKTDSKSPCEICISIENWNGKRRQLIFSFQITVYYCRHFRNDSSPPYCCYFSCFQLFCTFSIVITIYFVFRFEKFSIISSFILCVCALVLSMRQWFPHQFFIYSLHIIM